MHPIDEPASTPPVNNTGAWYTHLTRYHWFVLVVAALGWLFDTMDQQLFVLARPAAMKELVVPESKTEDPKVTSLRQREAGDLATSIFIAGWACGGLFFGMMGDRIGRAKTMLITILVYSACTGLSAFSVGVYDFAFYRFLTAGVGGEFAVGVALVPRSCPRAPKVALGLLQALSAVGTSRRRSSIWALASREEGLVTALALMFMIGPAGALAIAIRWS